MAATGYDRHLQIRPRAAPANSKALRYVEIVDALQLNSSGKVV
jgi:hypothetical protein